VPEIGSDRMVGFLGEVFSPFRPTSRKRARTAPTLRRRDSTVSVSSAVNCPDFAATITVFSYLLIYVKKRKENSSCSVCRHPLQDLAHLLDCLASKPLRHAIFGITSSIFWPLVQTLGCSPTVGPPWSFTTCI